MTFLFYLLFVFLTGVNWQAFTEKIDNTEDLYLITKTQRIEIIKTLRIDILLTHSVDICYLLFISKDSSETI